MTKAARFIPLSLLLLGAVFLIAAMLAVSGTTMNVPSETGDAKYTQMTSFKSTGTSNGKSPCGKGKSAPPPYTPAKGGAKDECKPTP